MHLLYIICYNMFIMSRAVTDDDCRALVGSKIPRAHMVPAGMVIMDMEPCVLVVLVD